MSETSTVSATPALQRKSRLPRFQEMGLIIVILVISLFLWLASGSVTQTLPAMDVNGVHYNMEEVQQNGFMRPSWPSAPPS
jgi:hypothetical protein